MESLIINPTLLTFLTTYTCTSSCKNCCFQCNPKRKEKLSVEDMISYIDKCIDSYSSIKMLVLSGGGGFSFWKITRKNYTTCYQSRAKDSYCYKWLLG